MKILAESFISKLRTQFFLKSLHAQRRSFLLKFIYSEKATNFCEISTLDLPYVVTVKSTVENSQNFMAFSEIWTLPTWALGSKERHETTAEIWSFLKRTPMDYNPVNMQYWNHSIQHSVLERIWVKGSYLSQWLPQGERRPSKKSKSQWIEIFHGGSH